MQGAPPLASPRLNPRGTGSPCRCGKLNGGLPRAALARPANPVPGGGRRGVARLTLPLACFSAPIPPPPFPSGEGGDFRLFYARGFAPCIPATKPARHWFALPLWKTQWGLASALPTRRMSAAPGGGAGRRSPADLAAAVFAGGLAFFAASLPCLSGRRRGAWRFWSPACPAFSLLSFPHPPAPLPGGKGGEIFSLFCRGLRPRHPGIRPFAARTAPAMQVPGGGLACFVARLPCL